MGSLLGIGGELHDSNTTLLDEHGTIKKAINEERLTRKKKDGRFPFASLSWIEEDDAIVVVATNTYEQALKELISVGYKLKDFKPFLHRLQFYDEELGKKKEHVGHHESHAASAYYTSGVDEALIITMDGGSVFEPWCTTTNHGKNGKLAVVEKSTECFTDEYFFTTALLGFTPNMHEGKITGLAAYGTISDDVWEFFENQRISGNSLPNEISSWSALDNKSVSPLLVLNEERLAEYRKQFKDISMEEIAATVQAYTEQRVLDYIKKNAPHPEKENIALAGGIFGNVRINQKIKELGFKHIFIHPGMSDEGLSMGAAMAYAGKIKGLKPQRLQNVFFGPNFNNNDIKNTLEQYGLRYEVMDSPIEKIAYLLAEGKVIVCFTGRMEYGPRALGNRSILYQTTDIKVNDWLNKRLQRTEFMPFAPATLAEYANKCYKDVKGAEYTAEFMTITFNCSNTMKRQSPSVVHVDGTARPQIVTKEGNPLFHAIINEYYELTGIPSVINTSFNNHGEPIVCTPDDAIFSFLKSELDYLAIGNYLVKRKQ